MHLRDGIKNWLQIKEQLSKRGSVDTYNSVVGFEEEREAAGSIGAFFFSVQFQSSGVDLFVLMILLLSFCCYTRGQIEWVSWKYLSIVHFYIQKLS